MPNNYEQAQIQAMIQLLAEKFIKDPVKLQRLKELINMGIISDMIRDDVKIEIAKRFLRRGLSVKAISEDVGLDEAVVLNLQDELENETKHDSE